jgi:iron uptake system EfeUOB component EfeO/EfeM
MTFEHLWAWLRGIQAAKAARQQAPASPVALLVPPPNSSAAPEPVAEAIIQAPRKEQTMSDAITQDVTAVAKDGAATVISTIESAAGSVISKIASGALTVWDDIEGVIDADAAKISKTLPASAQTTLAATVSDVKQGASDAISMLTTAGAAVLPTLAKDGEAVLDQALATYSNGVALPLVPMVNAGIDEIVGMAVAAAQAWGLKAKASLAS